MLHDGRDFVSNTVRIARGPRRRQRQFSGCRFGFIAAADRPWERNRDAATLENLARKRREDEPPLFGRGKLSGNESFQANTSRKIRNVFRKCWQNCNRLWVGAGKFSPPTPEGRRPPPNVPTTRHFPLCFLSFVDEALPAASRVLLAPSQVMSSGLIGKVLANKTREPHENREAGGKRCDLPPSFSFCLFWLLMRPCLRHRWHQLRVMSSGRLGTSGHGRFPVLFSRSARGSARGRSMAAPWLFPGPDGPCRRG